jgi:Fe-S-cluster containining protein
LNALLALITLATKLNGFADLSLEQKSFRFRCKRCAALCCKIGGPVLTRKDVEQIAEEGYSVKDFIEPVSRDGKSPFLCSSMKNREDGSCIFLEFDDKMKCYKCGIYDFRPVLCRLYPFNFEFVDSNRIALKFIPCCRGLNNRDGDPVNRNFISSYLLEPLLEVIEQHKNGVNLF